MPSSRSPGFTLVELVVVLTVIAIVLTFSVPALRSLGGSHSLKGSAENIVAQLRLARQKAVSTGVAQPVHFLGTNVYHIHYASGVSASAQWTLPLQIKFGRNLADWYTMTPDGRVVATGNADGVIPLVDDRGNRDTVTVQSSGTVLAY